MDHIKKQIDLFHLLLGNVLKSVPLIGSVVSGIKLLSEPVAKMFGVPDEVLSVPTNGEC